MPYIQPKDREVLDPLIAKLSAKIVKTVTVHLEKDPEEDADYFKQNCLANYLRLTSLRILQETALNAAEQYRGKRAIRYAFIADQAGIVSNIMDELVRRVWNTRTGGGGLLWNPESILNDRSEDCEQLIELSAPNRLSELEKETQELISAISRLSGPEGHNDQGAYKGLVNYTLTNLVPRTIIDGLKVGEEEFDDEAANSILAFWWAIRKELYQNIAAPYEDEQIAKNEDVPIYEEIKSLLG